MNIKKTSLILASFCMLLFFSGLRSESGKSYSETVLVGCTPGDPLIKSALNIFYRTNVDFIRWNLTLRNETGINTFVLNLTYGEAKANTAGFKEGEEKLNLEGVYSVSENSDGILKKIIYQLKCYDNRINIISFIKINDNLFHLLTPGKQLMVGNSGWSYTLSRRVPVNSSELPSITISSDLLKNAERHITFEGRTPCSEFARENNLQVAPGCAKIKWILTLNRDPVNLSPTTYKLLWISDKQTEAEGKWTIIKGSPSNPESIIYKLDPDKPEMSISLFAADKNVVFFLDKESQLIIGNGDFSYTLNKKYIGEESDPANATSMDEY